MSRHQPYCPHCGFRNSVRPRPQIVTSFKCRKCGRRFPVFPKCAKKVCKFCNTLFQPKRITQTCCYSPSCTKKRQDEWKKRKRRRKLQVQCPKCCHGFTVSSTEEPPKELPCAVCQRPFTRRHPAQILCGSQECKDARRNERYRNWYNRK